MCKCCARELILYLFRQHRFAREIANLFEWRVIYVHAAGALCVLEHVNSVNVVFACEE
jgi:hypothetical protein